MVDIQCSVASPDCDKDNGGEVNVELEPHDSNFDALIVYTLEERAEALMTQEEQAEQEAMVSSSLVEASAVGEKPKLNRVVKDPLPLGAIKENNPAAAKRPKKVAVKEACSHQESAWEGQEVCRQEDGS